MNEEGLIVNYLGNELPCLRITKKDSDDGIILELFSSGLTMQEAKEGLKEIVSIFESKTIINGNNKNKVDKNPLAH